MAALLGVDLLRQARQAELRRDVGRAREIARGLADIGVDVDDRPGPALPACRAGTPARSSRRRAGSWRGPGASRRSTASSKLRRGTLMPALLTSTSTSPKRASTAAPIAATASGVADVARETRRPGRGPATRQRRGLGERDSPPADQGDLPPFGRELERDGPADAAASARDDRGVHRHRLPSAVCCLTPGRIEPVAAAVPQLDTQIRLALTI